MVGCPYKKGEKTDKHREKLMWRLREKMLIHNSKRKTGRIFLTLSGRASLLTVNLMWNCCPSALQDGRGLLVSSQSVVLCYSS